jgi:endonuclease/exonuclease/phosphatase family metal-dependent hydrolase
MLDLLRRSFALTLAFAVSAQDPTTPRTADPDVRPLRVGTWNLEQLGFRGDPKRPDDAIARIADHVRELGVDVLAVQEIGGPKPLAELTRALGESWEFVVGTTGGFRGGDAPGRISVGFVFDTTRVTLLVAEELAGLPQQVEGTPIFHRVPVSATFRTSNGGLDFRAVVVHLKAGRTPADAAKRVLEVAALRRLLDTTLARDGEDQDLVVLGDFNHTFGTAEHAAMTEGGRFRYATSRVDKPTIVHFREPIDHFAIGRGLEPEVVADSRLVHDERLQQDPQTWRAVFSDHVPVTIEFDQRRDGDPTARFQPIEGARTLTPDRRETGSVRVVPASRGTTSVDADLPQPLQRNDRVRVLFVDSRPPFTGVLLATPDLWVHLRTDTGARLAIPREHVSRIEAL